MSKAKGQCGQTKDVAATDGDTVHNPAPPRAHDIDAQQIPAGHCLPISTQTRPTLLIPALRSDGICWHIFG